MSRDPPQRISRRKPTRLATARSQHPPIHSGTVNTSNLGAGIRNIIVRTYSETVCAFMVYRNFFSRLEIIRHFFLADCRTGMKIIKIVATRCVS